MKRTLCIIFAVCLFQTVAGCQEKFPADSDVKEDLLQATVVAVKTEIRSLEDKLATAESGADTKQNAEEFRKRILGLKNELDRLSAMKPEAYPDGEGTPPPDRRGPLLPAVRKEVTITVKSGYGIGSLLDLDNATRSGPFYHLAGIRGGCPCVLAPGRRYRLMVYLVFRREYFGFIEDSYVYVAEYRER
jgi:hypothetical protein